MKITIIILFQLICLLPQSNHQKVRKAALPCGSLVLQYRRLEMPLNNQIDSLPPIKTLHHSIDSFYAHQTHLQLLEFKDSKKGNWLKYLPNLGITYTVNGQPRPSLSINSGILYQAKKDQQTRAVKRQSIIAANRLAAEKAKRQLAELLLQYEQLQDDLASQKTLFALETDLFLIKEDEYHRQELAPSDYLQAKKTYLLQQQSLTEIQQHLERFTATIKIHCHYPLTRN